MKKLLLLLIATAVMALATPVVPAAVIGDVEVGEIGSGDQGEVQSRKKKTLKPGDDCFTNGDGVKVCNYESSGGNAVVDPKEGDGDSETTVTTKTKFNGSISGLDGNDTAKIGSSNGTTENPVTVAGTAGTTVTIGGGSHVHVVNDSITGDLKVKLPSGTTVDVGPGSHLTFHT